MRQLSQKPTVDGLWRLATQRLRRAALCYGHGTDNARDEAAVLLSHVLQTAGLLTPATLRRHVSRAQQQQLEALLDRRIGERMPAAYLTGTSWFAGLPFYVDERVLIPRSPLAELIEQSFSPWIDAARVRRICDIGTGSGCIAIACAYAFTGAQVDAVDLSAEALTVARLNIARHRLDRRVKARKSDHFRALGRATYDIIVSNPPYVGHRELAELPVEYRHEPRMGLAAGRDGLDSVRALLRDAARHLVPGGILVVEVGNSEHLVRRRYPRLPFTWLEFSRGGGGVFLLSREQLMEYRDVR